MGKFRVFLCRFFAACVSVLVVATPIQALAGGIADPSAQQQLLQQERERSLRQQQEPMPDARQPDSKSATIPADYPENESPCFLISKLELIGEKSDIFQFALSDVVSGQHSALNRCLGTEGLNHVLARVQNAIIAKGYVTTRVLASPQDLKSGTFQLTVVPGLVDEIRFSEDSSHRGRKWNAVPMAPGDLLNLWDIEQGLENFKRAPTAEADIQIEPAAKANAKPGESDVVIRYKQRFPLRLTLSADDGGYDSTGKYQGGATLSGDNLLTLNDLFYANYHHDLGGGDSGNRGSKGHTLHYSLPYGYWLFGATSSGYDFHQEVAGINQSYLYSGRTQNAELKASRMVFRNSINKTLISLSSFFRKSFNFIDDTEIEVQRRRTAGWVLGFTQSWFIGPSMLDYTVAYRRGTGAMEALKAPEENFDEGTSRMELMTADVAFNLPFSVQAPWGNQTFRYSTNLRGQSNLTPLVPQDRFAIGNRYTVRGFDGQLILSADRGWFVRNDLMMMLGASGQALYVGLDYGEVSGQSSDLLLGKHLAGAVLGFRGGYKGLSYDVFLGRPLSKPQGFETAKTAAGFNLNWTF